jgi:hypothetical protein
LDLTPAKAKMSVPPERSDPAFSFAPHFAALALSLAKGRATQSKDRNSPILPVGAV